MRIRYKKWARPELEASSFYIANPEEYKGRWSEIFNNGNPINIELGCGKGNFISELAHNNQNINYIAIDLIDAMLGLTKRNIEKVYRDEDIKNLRITRFDIERISLILDEKDKIEKIYINFCNPWPKPKHRKKRLTYTKQLQQYKTFLIDGGEVLFKTDDYNLYKDSLKYFEETGFIVENKTEDLHNEHIFENNIITEHEKMFSDQGIKIKALIAKKISKYVEN